MAWTAIDLPGADVALDPDWLPRTEADTLMETLLTELPWEVHRIRMFGRVVDSPRLSCWIGDPGASYAYSGTRFEPHPWPDVLLPIRERASATCGEDFDSVLANLYRDGRDSMGWHRDDEPELGPGPVIASLSLGATRRFLLKPNQGQGPRDAGSRSERVQGSARGTGLSRGRSSTVALVLAHGSLLLMRGDTQRNVRHALPRTARPVGPRVNLTFRRINGVAP
jgi:alkylated DNA repair dioxygenase AlkB